MDDLRSKISWKNQLNYTTKTLLNRDKVNHEKFKNRFITVLENLYNDWDINLDIIAFFVVTPAYIPGINSLSR